MLTQAISPPLPAGFTTVKDVLDEKVSRGSLINIISVVTDVRTPVPTRRTDWKCQLRVYDASVEDDFDSSLLLNIFRPKDEMPQNIGCGDVILLRSVKVQKRDMEAPSLLFHFSTKMFIYAANEIPSPPRSASRALRPAAKASEKTPGATDGETVSSFFHALDKSRVPEKEEFELMKVQSANIKDKSSELQGVCDGNFYDLVAQVVKEPHEGGDKITLWISDYTENPLFYHYSIAGQDLLGGRDGDPYNYTAMVTKQTAGKNDWKGPFGKKSLQVTCYEPHATAIRACKVTNGSWVTLKNVQVKYGRNGANLEGFLREDQGANGPKIQISTLDPKEDPENINSNLKASLHRKREYERKKKQQLKGIEEAAKAGQKRKARLESGELGRKQRRLAKRALQNTEQPVASLPAPAPTADLNPLIKCDHQNKTVSTIPEILEPIFYNANINKETARLQLPFANINYRANVRVVNFSPSRLEDFAVVKKTSEYDALTDDGQSDSDSSASEVNPIDDFVANHEWEWRFSLELEDSMPGEGPKRSFWVTVDNPAAQCLVNLDASNLRHDKDNLESLRQRLFFLWGNLEECKSRQLSEREKSRKAARDNQPPMDSSDDEQPKRNGPKKHEVANRPFPCCIRQFGIKTSEYDDAKADAGDGKRWQRVFGLFGTRISAS